MTSAGRHRNVYAREPGWVVIVPPLFKSVAALSGLQGIAYLIPLVSVPYLVRVLGTENFGRTAFALACIQYLVLLTDYGFSLSATRRAAVLQDSKAGLSEMACSVAALRVALCALGGLALTILVTLAPPFSADPELYFAAYLSVVGNALMPSWLLQGIGRMQVLAISIAAGQALALGALLLVVTEPSDYRQAVLLQGAGMCLASAMAWYHVMERRLLRFRWPSAAAMRHELVEGWPFFLSGASVSLYTTSNTVLLGLLGTPQAVGQFAAAEKLVRAVQGLMTPVSQAVFPHVARLSTASRTQALAFLRVLLTWQGLAAAALSMLLWLFAAPIVGFAFGPQASGSIAVVQWMALLPLLTGLSNVLGVQTMVNFGMHSQFNRILLFSGGLNVLLVFLAAPGHGAVGVASAIVATELFVVGAMAFAVWRAGLLAPLVKGT